jgi:hypothetical protein
MVSTKRKSLPQQPHPPQYRCVIELASGRSMIAESVEVKGEIVTIFVADGYELKLPKNNIRKIIE